MIGFSRNLRFVLVDTETGFVETRISLPSADFESYEIPAGKRVVIPADDDIPVGRVKLDLRKVRQPVNLVDSIASVQASWRKVEISAAVQLERKRQERLDDLDRRYAAHMAAVRGPLADLHAAKRRQAEAGDGPLVADEADRQAILAAASAEDEAIAMLERERRTIKERIKSAASPAEVDEIAAGAVPDKKGSLLVGKRSG
jgi:hypothetical protein